MLTARSGDAIWAIMLFQLRAERFIEKADRRAMGDSHPVYGLNDRRQRTGIYWDNTLSALIVRQAGPRIVTIGHRRNRCPMTWRDPATGGNKGWGKQR